MIIGKIHEGSGLGNQLHTYIMVRVLAYDKGFDFGFVGTENFKGNSLFQLDWGKPVNLLWHTEYPAKKLIVDSPHTLWEENSDVYNEKVWDVTDNMVIDGYFQAERYWMDHRKEVEDWLKTEVMNMPNDLCVINFRGGEYVGVPDLYLTHDYWDLALSEMRAKGIVKFLVCTDDPIEARKFFPDIDILHELARDWRMVRYAKHLILSNSSFAILPAWLSQADIIAPKFWTGRSRQVWHMPQNEYGFWRYL